MTALTLLTPCVYTDTGKACRRWIEGYADAKSTRGTAVLLVH